MLKKNQKKKKKKWTGLNKNSNLFNLGLSLINFIHIRYKLFV